MTMQTRVSRMLDIRHPIIQAGMAGVAGPELVASVSEAGGLGVLGGFNVPPNELRARIEAVRKATKRPFGVNLWTHPLVTGASAPRDPSVEDVRAVQSTLDGFRDALGLPAAPGIESPARVSFEEQLEVILEQEVPVLSVALGDPGDDLVGRCHRGGVQVMAMISTVEEAQAVEESGVDMIVAQGSEAGGHHATWTDVSDTARPGAMALLPRIVDAVECPVVVAGAVADGRGIASALCLGACGVMMGTRFVATRESLAPAFWKSAIVEADGHATVVTTAYTGLPARALRNTFSDAYAGSHSPVLPPLRQKPAARDIFDEAKRRADGRYFPMWAGQSTGLIHDVPSAAEVVARLGEQAGAALSSLNR